MKVSELTGKQLDYWVARAEGICLHDAPHSKSCGNWGTDYTCTRCGKDPEKGPNERTWRPSTDWAQGGPIVERERMNFATIGTGPKGENGQPPIVAIPQEGRRAMEGLTHLVAAMRAYVASKFGDEVADDHLDAQAVGVRKMMGDPEAFFDAAKGGAAPSDESAQRAAFEEWCAGGGPYCPNFPIGLNDIGDYAAPETMGAWLTWLRLHGDRQK